MAPFFIGLLSVLLGIVSVLIVLIVLMQRPKQEGLGEAFGGGMTDQMFGAQTTNVLQRGTVYLAVLFFVFSLILSVLTAKSVREDTKVVNDITNEEEAAKPDTEIPGASGIATPPIQIPSEPAPKPAEVEVKPTDASAPKPAAEVEEAVPAAIEEAVPAEVEEAVPATIEEVVPAAIEEVVPAVESVE